MIKPGFPVSNMVEIDINVFPDDRYIFIDNFQRLFILFYSMVIMMIKLLYSRNITIYFSNKTVLIFS